MAATTETSTIVREDPALAIIEDLVNGKIKLDDVKSKLVELKSNPNRNKVITYKVSPKGTISFYGIRRLPISLYLQELMEIVKIYNTPEFQTFIESNKEALNPRRK
ncbi:MAG: hypothetical protein ABIN35_00430 [candidate division WOR-3 bacterium]